MMRFAKILIVPILLFACSAVFGQSQPEEALPQEREFTKVHIFPNPAIEADYLHIRIQEVPANKVTLALHNILGNKIEVESEVVDEHEIRIKIKELASGYYFLALSEDESNFRGTYKVLKR